MECELPAQIEVHENVIRVDVQMYQPQNKIMS